LVLSSVANDCVFRRSRQLRDLRRTARTLMSRAGVSTEIAERSLGHVMTLVRGTYDRYDYLAEKQEAFEKLSAAVESIVAT
jgi:integrase